MKTRLYQNIYVLLVILFSLSCYGANEKPKRDFGFSGQEIYQIKSNSVGLNVTDINEDGLDDIIYVNNRTSRLEILVRKKDADIKSSEKTLENSFNNIGFVLDQQIKEIKIADLNGDDRLDIITLGTPYGLQIYYQKKNKKFEDAHRVYLGKNKSFIGMEIEDLDGNEKREIIICHPQELEILWNSSKQKFSNRSSISFSLDSCHFFAIGDFLKDNEKDLLLYFSRNELPLRIRTGIGKGKFGWEIPAEIPPVRFLKKLNLYSKKTTLGVILKNGTVFRNYGISKTAGSELTETDEVIPRSIPLRGISKKDTLTWLLGDFNKDGYMDFCIASPELSQLHIYYGHEKGFSSEPELIDSLAGVKKVIFDSNGNIIVFSSKEKSLARHFVDNLKKFPQLLATPATPLTISSFDKKTYMITPRDKQYELISVVWDKDGKIADSYSYPLKLENIPQAMKMFPLDKQSYGVLVFFSYHRPALFKINGEKISKLSSSEWNALSLKLKPNFVLYNKTDNELIVAEKKVARAYKWQKGRFQIVHQYNPTNDSSEIISLCQYSDSKKKSMIVLFDRSNDNLIFFPTNGKNKAKIKKTHLRGGVRNFVGMEAFTGKSGNNLLIIGRSEMLHISNKQDHYKLKIDEEYTSKAEKASLWYFNTAHLGKIKQPMIVLIDRFNRSLEILMKFNNRLYNMLTFEVFQSAAFNTPGGYSYEPHDLASGDINGDGFKDLVVLVHDKLIIYFGE